MLSFTLKTSIFCLLNAVQCWFLLCFLVLFVHMSVVRYTVHTEVLPSIWLNSPCSSVAWLLGGVRRVIRPSTRLLTATKRHCLRAAVQLWSVPDLLVLWSQFLLIFSTNLWFMIDFSITLSEILYTWFYDIKALFSYLILHCSVCCASGSVVLLYTPVISSV